MLPYALASAALMAAGVLGHVVEARAGGKTVSQPHEVVARQTVIAAPLQVQREEIQRRPFGSTYQEIPEGVGHVQVEPFGRRRRQSPHHRLEGTVRSERPGIEEASTERHGTRRQGTMMRIDQRQRLAHQAVTESVQIPSIASLIRTVGVRLTCSGRALFPALRYSASRRRADLARDTQVHTSVRR